MNDNSGPGQSDAEVAEFTYTRTLVDARQIDANIWLMTDRLEGNFPGNVVDLRYEFVLTGDLISSLVIAP